MKKIMKLYNYKTIQEVKNILRDSLNSPKEINLYLNDECFESIQKDIMSNYNSLASKDCFLDGNDDSLEFKMRFTNIKIDDSLINLVYEKSN